jgi:PmbA protein
MSLPLMGRDRVLTVLEDALRGSPADQTELTLLNQRTAVTRYANNEIHQNVLQENTRVGVRVVVNGAVARSQANSLAPADLAAAIEQAIALAKLLQPNPKFKSLPTPLPDAEGPTAAPYFYRSVSEQDPQARADAIRQIIAVADEHSFGCYGTYKTIVSELAVVNSLGVRAYAPNTSAYLRALFDNGEGTGYGDMLARDAAALDPLAIARTAAEKCRLNRNQIELPIGDYAAVLEPDCVADMVYFPVSYAFNARSVKDGRSYLTGKFGQQVTGKLVSWWDDARDPRCMPSAIDYEGMPTQRVNIVSDGVAEGVVYDSYAASQEEGKHSTGHAANPFESHEGYPYPRNLLMRWGEASTADLVRQMKRGVLMTRMHYTHCPDPARVIATGTTRDGTFLVENGEIVAAVKNMRFTQGIMDLFATTEAASQPKVCQDWWSQNGMDDVYYYLPAVRVGKITFTGVTTF